MRLITANQMSPNLIFNCAVRLDPGFAIGESSAGPFLWSCYNPNREAASVRHLNVQLAVFKKEFI